MPMSCDGGCAAAVVAGARIAEAATVATAMAIGDLIADSGLSA
jgi:hypothetical protein